MRSSFVAFPILLLFRSHLPFLVRIGKKEAVRSRVGNLGVRSGECCACNLFVSSYSEQIGAIYKQLIEKPAYSLSTLRERGEWAEEGAAEREEWKSS